jgi:hypothetical protein
MLFNLDQQPVKKRLMFRRPTLVVKELPQMPVRSMNDAHKTPCRCNSPGDYTGSAAKAKNCRCAVIIDYHWPE